MFKYYISKVEGGGGSRPSLILLMQRGWGVRNLEKCADVILERSLTIMMQKIDADFVHSRLKIDADFAHSSTRN